MTVLILNRKLWEENRHGYYRDRPADEKMLRFA